MARARPLRSPYALPKPPPYPPPPPKPRPPACVRWPRMSPRPGEGGGGGRRGWGWWWEQRAVGRWWKCWWGGETGERACGRPCACFGTRRGRQQGAVPLLPPRPTPSAPTARRPPSVHHQPRCTWLRNTTRHARSPPHLRRATESTHGRLRPTITTSSQARRTCKGAMLFIRPAARQPTTITSQPTTTTGNRTSKGVLLPTQTRNSLQPCRLAPRPATPPQATTARTSKGVLVFQLEARHLAVPRNTPHTRRAVAWRHGHTHRREDGKEGGWLRTRRLAGRCRPAGRPQRAATQGGTRPPTSPPLTGGGRDAVAVG